MPPQPADQATQLKTFLSSQGYVPPKQPNAPPAPSGGGWYSQLQKSAKPTGTPLFGNPAEDIKNAGNEVYEAITGTGARAGQNPLQRGIGAGSAAASAVLNTAADVVPGGKAALGAVSKGFDVGTKAAGNVSSTLADISQKLGIMSPEQRAEYDKRAGEFAGSEAGQKTAGTAQTLAELGNIANVILMAGGTPGAIETAAKGVKTTADLVKDYKNTTRGINAVEATVNPKPPADELKGQAIIEDKMRKTSDMYRVAARKLHEAETVNKTNPIGVISSYGKKALPVLENGKINPDEGIAFLDEQIGHLSNIKSDAVFLNTTKIPVADFVKHADDMIQAQKSYGWSEMRIKQARTQLAKEAEKMDAAYEGGSLDLNEIDKIKTEQTALSKAYKNPTAQPFQHDTHSILGKAARDLVEKSTEDAPTKELNKWIQSHYDAIDLLEALRARAPHGGYIAKMGARLTGEIFGAVAGSTVGHPFLGAIAGRIGADAVDGLIHSKFISNPTKRAVIEKMRGVDPAVKQQMLDYIDKNSPDIGELGDTTSNPSTSPRRPGQSGGQSGQSQSSPYDTLTPAEVKRIEGSPKADGGAPEDALKAEIQTLRSQLKDAVDKEPIVKKINALTRKLRVGEETRRVAELEKERLAKQGNQYTRASQKTAEVFNKGGGQKPLKVRGVTYDLGDFGRSSFARKGEVKGDRFPESELKKTLQNTVEYRRAIDDPTSHRYDHIAHIAEMPNGEIRVVYTRLNRFGHEEIINWHKVSNPKYIQTLESFGVPERARTSNLPVRTGTLYPLSYGDKGNSTITSKFRPTTLGGKVKQALQNYLEDNPPSLGLSAKDVTEGGQKFDIGLSSVKGETPTATDELAKEGDELYAKGDFAGAQGKYNEALKSGVETLTKSFEGSGIKIKARGVGIDVKKSGIEPNYDATAVVPKGKEDLFHYILSDVADKQFHQYSMLTSRQIASDSRIGVVDPKRGLSNEPAMHLTLDKALTGEDMKTIGEAAEKSGITAVSVREGGRTIDILNLSHYNTDYGQFIQQGHDFFQALERKGLSGGLEQRIAETRHVGSDTSHAAVSYGDFRNTFRKENPGYFNTDEGFTSRILDRLKNKQSVSSSELEQLTKSQDITPMERGVVLDAAADLDVNGGYGGSKMPVSTLAIKIKGKTLPITRLEVSQYATYGLDNVDLRNTWDESNKGETGAKTLVFESPVEHGNEGHFGNTKHIGHVRTFIEHEPNHSQMLEAKDAYEVRKVGEGKDAAWGVFDKNHETSYGAVGTESFKSKSAAQKHLDGLPKVPAEKRVGYITEVQSDVFQKNSSADLASRLTESEAVRNEKGKVVEKFNTERDKLHEEISTKMAGEGMTDAQRTNAFDRGYLKLTEERDAALKKIVDEASKNLTPEQHQFLNLGKNDRYKEVLLRGALQYLKEKGVSEVRIATPSSAAKIEGYFGGGEGTAPYTQLNGDPVSREEQLSPGDNIEYIGEEHTVVGTNYDGIIIARSKDVRSFSFDDFVSGEADNAWESAKYEIDSDAKKLGIDWTTEKGAAKMITNPKVNGIQVGISGYTEKILQAVIDGKDPEEVIKNDSMSRTDMGTLEDIYGKDNIFQNDNQIYVVDGETENLSQPSSYDAFDESTIQDIDDDPKAIDENFDKTQSTVLKGYLELYNKNLKRLAKEANVPLEKVEGNGSHTWYEMPLTHIKQSLFGG